MKDFFTNTIFFCVLLTVGSYIFGNYLKQKFKFKILNGMIISIAVTIVAVIFLPIELEDYQAKTKVLDFFLTPATICLAIPLYEQFEKLKSNWLAILCGILSGVLANLFSVLGFCLFLKIGHTEYVSLLPKCVTTAIGLSLSEELKGIPAITMAAIVVTGNLGNIFGEQLCHLFRIKNDVAKGIAIGTSSHVLGTTKAMEMGEVEGAMSSLSIAVAGFLTVIGSTFFLNLI